MEGTRPWGMGSREGEMTHEEWAKGVLGKLRVPKHNTRVKIVEDAIRAAVQARDKEWTHALHHAQENTPGGGEFRSSPTEPDIALCEEMFIGHSATAVLAEREAWETATGCDDPQEAAAMMKALITQEIDIVRARTAHDTRLRTRG